MPGFRIRIRFRMGPRPRPPCTPTWMDLQEVGRAHAHAQETVAAGTGDLGWRVKLTGAGNRLAPVSLEHPALGEIDCWRTGGFAMADLGVDVIPGTSPSQPHLREPKPRERHGRSNDTQPRRLHTWPVMHSAPQEPALFPKHQHCISLHHLAATALHSACLLSSGTPRYPDWLATPTQASAAGFPYPLNPASPKLLLPATTTKTLARLRHPPATLKSLTNAIYTCRGPN